MTSSRPSSFALTTPGPLRLYSTSELLKLPPPEWLVEGIMPCGGLVGLYGPPGSGKSFLAIDIALCVASGLPWRGCVVQRGFVLYISAEGGSGIGPRAQAWLLANGVQTHVPRIGWLTQSLPITSDSADMEALFHRLHTEVPSQPILVVIDTLARCLEGDENTQEDMGRFVAGADRFRQEFEATVLIVHHTRLDGTRERGNTAFRGAADTMMVVSSDGDPSKGHRIELACNKQKDAETFDTRVFALAKVPNTTSCVLKDFAQSSAAQVLALFTEGEGLRYSEIQLRANLGTQATKRALKRVQASGEIIKENGQYYKI